MKEETKMKTKNKALLLSLCAVLLVAVSVLGTLAYLTSKDSVVNTFSVGSVQLNLDEAKVNGNGDPIDKSGNKVTKLDEAERVDNNTYKLIPGHSYTKDPTVTLLKGSEKSYIKMTVTVSYANELDKIFADNKITDLTNVITGYDSTKWTYGGNTKDATANTRTYTFYYHETVSALDEAKTLEALFTGIKVPGSVTKEQLATLYKSETDRLTITAKAYAIQADGFDNKEAAWTAFDGQVKTN